MAFIYGLQSATRNYVFFRLSSLANWRKCNTLSVSSPGCHRVQMNYIVNKYQGLRVNQCDSFTFLPGNFHFCRTFNNKRTGFLKSTRSMDSWRITCKCPAWNNSSPRRVLLNEVAVLPAFSVLHPLNCFPTREIRSFHTSPCFQAAPVPLLLIILKPVQKLFAIIVGRGIRKWWQALPPNKKELFKESVRRNKWKLFLGLSTFGLLFIMFYFTHLEVSPITGRSKLRLLGKEHFRYLSELEYEACMEEFKNNMLTEKDIRYLTVKEVFCHLIECNGDIPGVSEISWVIHVVDKPGTDAFVLPNGQVFVFTGLLNSVTDTHQLSFLLGHEIAHAVLEHAFAELCNMYTHIHNFNPDLMSGRIGTSTQLFCIRVLRFFYHVYLIVGSAFLIGHGIQAEKASFVHLLDFLGLIFLTMIWAICPRDSLAVLGQWIQSKLQEFMFARPYSRTLEAEADKIGLLLAAKACVDVRASSVFWQQMEFVDRLSGLPKLPEWLSTHPSHENRAEHLDRLIPQVLKIREICNCPPLSEPDPRLLFRLSMKHFLEESQKEDLNITVKKQKTNTLPVEKQEQIPLTHIVEKRTSN